MGLELLLKGTTCTDTVEAHDAPLMMTSHEAPHLWIVYLFANMLVAPPSIDFIIPKTTVRSTASKLFNQTQRERNVVTKS